MTRSIRPRPPRASCSAAPSVGGLARPSASSGALLERKEPSVVNHGNVTPSVSRDDEPGGVTLAEAVQTTLLSLPQLRRLRFPDPETGKCSPERDAAGRTVLAALALYAVALQREDGYFLRSRCHLVPAAPPRCELVGETAQDVQSF